MRELVDVVWPTIAGQTPAEVLARDAKDAADVVTIRAANWDNDNELALTQAKSLWDVEKERRTSAETKASMYLAAIAAVVPIALPLCTSFYAEKFVKLTASLQVVTFALFVASTAYLVGAAWWAFRTFRVMAHHRVDAIDYANIWGKPDRKSQLVAELLVATRLNRHMVNWKTTCVRQSHEFILRALVTFISLVVIIVAWEPVRSLCNWITLIRL
ncbi:hypothetical protein N183_17515 [Sinorhizobium sp. Sb3]|uniref:hypothetical protein n=1 Tax=Sinorhizobium sp. Sb3 TaxID=1358417 RepID=UPI00071DE5CD|nr:hypothetical protein [Sinorhizobium sp. Sb3]KSV80390.1 hypothetical protein N183_17515 [Sinorhizobium sp. Sb3]